MVASTSVTCQAIGSGDSEIVAQDLQSVLGVIYGKAVDASDTAYNAKGQLDGYVTALVGKLDYEMTEIYSQLGMTRSE